MMILTLRRFSASFLTVSFALSLGLAQPAIAAHPTHDNKLKEVAQTGPYQLTGIAVTQEGRIFVNFPRWQEPYQYAVAEVSPGGKLTPYPSENWAVWDKNKSTAKNHLVCVQSVTVDKDDKLWILDPAAPKLGEVVEAGAPKLLKVDPKTNQVEQVIYFDAKSAPEKSYLNDVRVDTNRKFAYITESGLGAIVVVDLSTGKSWRTLENDPSTKAEPGLKLIVNGKDLRDDKGYTPQFNADGIAISDDGDTLYYHALTGKTLYQIDTASLRDQTMSDKDRAQHVQALGKTSPSDGMWLVGHDILFGSMEDNAVKKFNLETKEETPVVQSSELFWPDSFAEKANGDIIISASQIQHMARFNNGKANPQLPYKAFEFKP